MANLLRLSRKIFSAKLLCGQYTTFVANGVGATPSIPWFLARQLSTTPIRLVEAAEQSNASSKLTLDEHILQLDNQVQRWGRLDKEQVDKILELVQQQGHVTQRQGLVLIRSTGSLLVKESPETRRKIFKNVWDQLVALGMNMETAEHNAALKAQLENEQTVSVTDFLQSLGDCKPNRVTYQLMVAQYCEEGDIESASKILEHMKAENVPVTEAIFNHMIKGYMKRRDVVAAEEMLNTMSSMSIFPTDLTYKELMVGHAEAGDMDGIKKVMMMAQQDEVSIHPRRFFDCVYKLATRGHSQHVNELLSLMPRHRAYNHDAINMVHQLCAIGHIDEAMLIRDVLQADLKAMTGLHRTILRGLIERGQPLETIFNLMEKFEDDTHFPGALAFLITTFAQNNQPGKSLELLKLAKEKGTAMKPNLFWGVFNHFHQDKDVEGIYETLNVLIQVADGKLDVFLPTICLNGAKSLLRLGESIDSILSRFEGYGLPKTTCQVVMMYDLFLQGKYGEACQQAKSGGMPLPPFILKSDSVAAYIVNPDADGLAKLLVVEHGRSLNHLHGYVLLDILKLPSMDKTQAEALISAWNDNELLIQSTYEGDIMNKLEKLGVSPEAKEGDRWGSLTIEALEVQLEKRKLNEANVIGVQNSLLQKYCEAGAIEQADTLKAEMDAQNFVYRPEALRQLALLACKYKQNLEETNTYVEMLQKEHPDFLAYTDLMLHRAILQAQNHQLDEAVAGLKKHASHRQGLGYDLVKDYKSTSMCIAFLEACRASESCTPDMVWEIGNLLMSSFTKEGTYGVLKEIVAAYIDREDAEGALRALTNMAETYQRVPHYRHVFQLLIKNEDANRLQKVVDLAMTTFSHNEVLLCLVVEFIRFDKIKQAVSLLETPQLRISQLDVEKLCTSLVQAGEEDIFRQLIELTKGRLGGKRDEMLFQMIRLQVLRKNDLDAAEQMLEQYEEEGVLPSPRTLRYLDTVFRKVDRPVTFDVPAKTDDTANDATLKEERKNPFVLEDLIRKYANGEDVTPEYISHAIEVLGRRRQNNVISRVLHTLATHGDKDILMSIDTTKLTERFQKTVKICLMKAATVNGTITEFLDDLKEDPSKLGDFISTGTLASMSREAPEQFERVEEYILNHLATTEAAEQAIPMQYLFGGYMMTGEYDKAEKMLESYPKMKTMNTLFITDKLAAEKDEAGLLKLKELFSSVRPIRVFLNQLIKLRVSNKDYDGALKYVEEAKENGVEVTELWPRPLLIIEDKLSEEGRPVPWEKGTVIQKRRRRDVELVSSSDTSDSSDSDEEKTLQTNKGN